MRKIWFMLLLISSVSLFTACSDDDNNGDGDSKGPITGLTLSDEVSTGVETTILGKGFAEGDKLIVADAAGERTEIEGAVASTTGMTFTLPETLASGKYSLILKRGADEWTLGEFKVVRMKEITVVKTFRMYSPDPEGGDPYMDATFHLDYDDYGRLVAYYSMGKTEDGSEIKTAYEFIWSENKIEVGGNAIDPDMGTYPITYILENGKVKTSSTKEAPWGGGDPTDIEYTWTYTADEYLSSLTGITYSFEDGNLMSIDDGMMPEELEYSEVVNNTNIDYVSYALNSSYIISTDRFFPYIMGVAGKISRNIPNYAGGSWLNIIPDEKQGFIKSFDVDSGWGVTTLSFTYETVRVLAD